MKYSNITLGKIEAVWNKLGGEDGVEKFLRGELVVQPVIEKLDFIVSVDRNNEMSYPGWIEKVIHENMKKNGPNKYDVRSLELLLHENQKNGLISTKEIYEYIQEKNILENCLGLSDLLAIQKKGIIVFNTIFQGKSVIGWRSIAKNSIGGDMRFPYLIEKEGEVKLIWGWPGFLGLQNPIFFFKK